MILIQDLLLNDPADKVPLRAVIEYYKHTALKCKLQDSLTEMFDRFRKGASHMAFVYNNNDIDVDNKSNVKEAVGIITIEDLIEELVQSEIMDEADTKRKRRRESKKNKFIYYVSMYFINFNELKGATDFLKGKLVNLSLSTENLNMFVTDDQTNRPIISTQIRKALFYFLASSKFSI
jgi:CBS domain containing-hemolysin-like protein